MKLKWKSVIKDSAIKPILQYKNNTQAPNFVTIRNQYKNKATFSFAEDDQKEVEHFILN